MRDSIEEVLDLTEEEMKNELRITQQSNQKLVHSIDMMFRSDEELSRLSSLKMEREKEIDRLNKRIEKVNKQMIADQTMLHQNLNEYIELVKVENDGTLSMICERLEKSSIEANDLQIVECYWKKRVNQVTEQQKEQESHLKVLREEKDLLMKKKQSIEMESEHMKKTLQSEISRLQRSLHDLEVKTKVLLKKIIE